MISKSYHVFGIRADMIPLLYRSFGVTLNINKKIPPKGRDFLRNLLDIYK